jgi:hypothetical protein
MGYKWSVTIGVDVATWQTFEWLPAAGYRRLVTSQWPARQRGSDERERLERMVQKYEWVKIIGWSLWVVWPEGGGWGSGIFFSKRLHVSVSWFSCVVEDWARTSRWWLVAAVIYRNGSYVIWTLESWFSRRFGKCCTVVWSVVQIFVIWLF